MKRPVINSRPIAPTRRVFLKGLTSSAMLLGATAHAAALDSSQSGPTSQEGTENGRFAAAEETLGLIIDIPPSTLQQACMTWQDRQDPMATRLFQTTELRNQTSLNGWWDFVTDPKEVGEASRYFETFPVPEATLWVPGTWNLEPRYASYMGTAWYRRHFDMQSQEDVRIQFSGLFYKAKVWLDDELLGEHDDSYLPCAFIVRKLSKGQHTLTLSVNNCLSATTMPKAGSDWFPFGGIFRPVMVETVAPIFIERFNVTTTSVDASGAHMHAKLWVQNSGSPSTEALTLHIDNQPVLSKQCRIESGSSTLEFDVHVRNPRLWSPDEPNLYSSRAVLGRDDQYTRFGIRVITVKGDQILLNGQRIKLRGVNRHEDHPDWGSAMPPHLIRKDVEIIKRLGGNAVRIHYPVADMFLDYCDQNGLLSLSEMPAWQFHAEQLQNKAMNEKMKRYFREMVKRDGGHACVLYWSLGNEWPKPDNSYDVIKELVAYARSVDPSRLITIVTAQAIAWRIHQLLDVVCVNWAAYRWYDPGTDLEAGAKDDSERRLRLLHERYPNKPVIITEFGGAESQEGWHSWGDEKWSEEYQTKNVIDSGRLALAQEWISGGCVWEFADSQTSPELVLKGRLHGWNGKGILDGYRSPKLAFYALQELYRSYAETAAPAGRG